MTTRASNRSPTGARRRALSHIAPAHGWLDAATELAWKNWLTDPALQQRTACGVVDYRISLGPAVAPRIARVVFQGSMSALYACLTQHQNYTHERLLQLPFRVLHACADCETVTHDCLIAEPAR